LTLVTTRTIKVLIVDASALIRTILSKALSNAPDIEVVAEARDPYDARDRILEYQPDVIILDIELPRMDGMTFLKVLRKNYPVPVIICSGAAPSNSDSALRAMELGAVDVVAKPTGGAKSLHRLAEVMADKIRAASVARLRPFDLSPVAICTPAPVAAPPAASFAATGLDPSQYIVAIGASTGGTEALHELLSACPPDFPATAVVQHMPEGFTASLARRLNAASAMSVCEATDGDSLAVGQALLARGGVQMSLSGARGAWHVHHGSRETVNRHCPSVDVLFDSVAACGAKAAIGILLTGMGADGAHGLLKVRGAGGLTFTQDKASCTVYGMPKVADELGASMHSAPPADLPRLVTIVMKKYFGTTNRLAGN
jgi:two-component system chemotaxis response regulator CheB